MYHKHTPTDHPIVDLLANRWSPRSFSEEDITDEELNQLFEAARWAPSSMNEQPWRFIYARKGEEAHDKMVKSLMEGNQGWAREAPVLLLTIIRTTFSRNDKTNRTAQHDLGLAVANMTIQGTSLGIGFHQMGGVHTEQAGELFGIEAPYEVITAIALGRFGKPEQLDEPLRSREKEERSRKPISSWVGHGSFGENVAG